MTKEPIHANTRTFLSAVLGAYPANPKTLEAKGTPNSFWQTKKGRQQLYSRSYGMAKPEMVLR
jgi:hypothetical protein